jgi:ubiquinone/menaquinone biosynthesis C-methylase UbiE
MPFKNLLSSLPSVKRSLSERKYKKNSRIIKVSKKFDKEYFDGTREFGYGGYKYDGRWKPVAKDIISFFNLKKKDKILDIGCAKGFLVKDLLDEGIDAFGVDISEYAIKNCHPDIIGRVSLANAKKLPFPSNSFDSVISINCIHNLKLLECKKSIKEISRVAKSNKNFIQVDSYKNIKEKKLFLDWVLTAETHFYPAKWIEVFKKSSYKGYWNWTLL